MQRDKRTNVMLLLALLGIAGASTDAAARGSESRELWTIDGGCSGIDLPARAPAAHERADTLNFGYVQTIGGQLYAVPGEAWTFDHGGGGLEGWYAVDRSMREGEFARRIDAASWTGHGNSVAAPIIAGAASAWVGAFEDEADALCWTAGLGYGNRWCQRWVSPAFSYVGTGSVTVAFDYFNDSEPTFDFTHVRLELASGDRLPLNGAGFDDKIGDPATHDFKHVAYVSSESSFQGQPSFSLVFEFVSDGAWSDEDGEYSTNYGPFGVDNVALTGPGLASPVTYDYESGTQGWTNSICSGVGTFFGIHDVAEYTILDPCGCGLLGNVLGLHAGSGDAGDHPDGQHVLAYSPPADKSGLGLGCFTILAEWDQYSIQPIANGVFHRPGWNYYPYVCPTSGLTMWSGRKGQSIFNATGIDPICFQNRNVATDWGIPGDAQLVSFAWEVYSSCDAFGIPPQQCSNVTNFTPLIDNVVIRVTKIPCAPVIAFDPGTYFQDGFSKSPLLSTTLPGNADITYDLAHNTPPIGRLGDSLLVKGPTPTSSTKYEAKFWFRVRREGPGQASASGYAAWKTAVSDGLSIVGASGQFAMGRMDSAQVSPTPYRDRFISEFREDDDDYVGEFTNNNEMLRDGIYTPGTQLQYFITANYTCTPADAYYLPDTSGQNFFEFEILPGFRMDGGVAKIPAVLTIDINASERSGVEHALNSLFFGAGPTAPIPNPSLWDRYDYNDACSCWNAPFARTTGGRAGATLTQLMGYRQIILYGGRGTAGEMWVADFLLFSDWLGTSYCGGNGSRQGFLAASDDMPTAIADSAPSFALHDVGVGNVCPSYHTAGCGPSGPVDQSECVRLESAPGGLYSPLIPVDVAGNDCPTHREFDVTTPIGGAVGNRVFRDYDRVPPIETQFAQVVKSATGGGSGNYRSVISGYSFGSLSTRDGQAECVIDAAHNVPSITEELRAALNWIFADGGGGLPGLIAPAICPITADAAPSASQPGVTRLFENRPNPFNPLTAIRFALGSAGRTELTIYDVSGRAVRTLVDA
ncbi:MAG: hypothetical protein U0527_07700, partial [Candidatus Eisenbacteria bacterium]